MESGIFAWNRPIIKLKSKNLLFNAIFYLRSPWGARAFQTCWYREGEIKILPFGFFTLNRHILKLSSKIVLFFCHFLVLSCIVHEWYAFFFKKMHIYLIYSSNWFLIQLENVWIHFLMWWFKKLQLANIFCTWRQKPTQPLPQSASCSSSLVNFGKVCNH